MRGGRGPGLRPPPRRPARGRGPGPRRRPTRPRARRRPGRRPARPPGPPPPAAGPRPRARPPPPRPDRLLAELPSPPGGHDLAAIHAPAGLDIGADGAEQVATAIVAEILAALHGRAGGRLRDRHGSIHS